MALSGVWDPHQLEADYAWQKFFGALCQAITSTGSLQQRLASLVWSIRDLRRENFPDDETWLRFERFVTATTSQQAIADQASVKAAMLQMKDEDAQRWLQEALQIFSDLSGEPDE